MLGRKGDSIQLIYNRRKSQEIEVLESFFIGQDSEFVFLDSGKYRKRNIMSFLNVSEQQRLANEEPED
jgi:hypothetical protein